MEEVRYRLIAVVHSPLLPDEHVPPRRVDARGVEGTVEVLSE